jgi:hypothetical protein
MAHYRGTISSPRPAADVFAYMADFANVADWDPTAAEARPLQEGEPGLGSRFHVLVRWLGREKPLEFEPPGAWSCGPRASPRSPTTRSRSSRGDGVRDYDARVTLKGAARLIDPALGVASKRLGDNAAAGLRRELGGEGGRARQPRERIGADQPF